jgi:hypothetical protein
MGVCDIERIGVSIVDLFKVNDDEVTNKIN